MSWLTALEAGIFQTPDAGASPNVDFDTRDIDPNQYPEFHQHMKDEGWDNLDASGRQAAVDRYVGGVVMGCAQRAQQAYGWSDYETMMAMGGWSGYSEREIREKWGPKQVQERQPRRALIPRLIHALLPF